MGTARRATSIRQLTTPARDGLDFPIEFSFVILSPPIWLQWMPLIKCEGPAATKQIGISFKLYLYFQPKWSVVMSAAVTSAQKEDLKQACSSHTNPRVRQRVQAPSPSGSKGTVSLRWPGCCITVLIT